MSAILASLIKTSCKFIEVSKKMVQGCIAKKNKKRTYSRYVISFFFRRAIEMFEVFIILIREEKLADSEMMLRSFIEMGINTGYIYENEDKKEMNALRYVLNGSKEQKKILEENIDSFKEIGIDAQPRIEKIKKQIEEENKRFKTAFPDEKTGMPTIEQRAEYSISDVLKKLYDQLYRYFSNIEHNNTWFGRDYVDEEGCSPVEEIIREFGFAPESNLWMFRSIFLIIMKKFNDEFYLKWGKVISQLERQHEAEYRKMKATKSIDKMNNSKKEVS